MGRLAARAKNQIEVRMTSENGQETCGTGYGIPCNWGSAHRMTDDPRPDLSDDSHLWTEMLRLASGFHPAEPEKNSEYTATLNHMRCGGTLIVAGAQNWLLRPLIDEARGWESQEAYDEAKKVLARWSEWIKMTLRQLGEKYPVRT